LVYNLALLFSESVVSSLWVKFAKLLCKDSMGSTLLQRLPCLLKEVEQLRHPENPDPGWHLLDVEVDELTQRFIL